MEGLLGGIGFGLGVIGLAIALALVIWATNGFPKFWKD